MNVFVGILCIVASWVGYLRWARVAQREHYIAGYTSRYARRWWTNEPYNVISAFAGLLGAMASIQVPVAGVVTAAVVACAPFGLSLRGRTSPLRWTRRMKTTTLVVGALVIGFDISVGATSGTNRFASTCAIVAMLLPLIVDLGLFLLAPAEKKMAEKFVDKAKAKLSAHQCRIIAVTGSYGKTTTKNYLRTLMSSQNAVASPASFNNRAGLSRAINESLPDDASWFIAEMDAYGPGEIAELVEWVKPEIGVLAAVGPVHLERFKDEDEIVTSLAEVFNTTSIAVINTDDDRLAKLADEIQAKGQRVIRCGMATGDVCVKPRERELDVFINDELLTSIPAGVHVPGNVACAIGGAIAAGVSSTELKDPLTKLLVPPHRRTVESGKSGATIIDNTFNSSPAGVAFSLQTLQLHAKPDHRAIVVTPGIIELGELQGQENEKFGHDAAEVATDLIVVGRTNRSAIISGARGGKAAVKWFATREDAVTWVRSQVGEGDVILYENDLPDHIP